MGSRGIRTCMGAVIVMLLGLLMLHWPSADVQLYDRYGEALRQGRLGQGLPQEYPALAGALFVVPFYLGLPYPVAFGLLCLAVLVALLAAGYFLLWDAETSSVWLFLGSVAAGMTWVVFRRYDVFPALAVVVAVGAARSGRWGTAWAASVGGALLKIFPAVLLPGFLLIEWRRTGSPPWRRAVASAAVVLAAAAGQQAIAPGTVLKPALYELRRGLEFSSVPGSLTFILQAGHATWSHADRSWQLVGGPAGVVSAMLVVVGLLSLAWLWRLCWRGRLEVVDVSLAVLSVVVLVGKAFPPQYMLWLAPLWAANATGSSRAARLMWLVACALTTVTYPVAYALTGGPAGDLAGASVSGAARNAALVAATCIWLGTRLRGVPRAAHLPDIAGGSVDELRPRSVVRAMLEQ